MSQGFLQTLVFSFNSCPCERSRFVPDIKILVEAL